MKVTPIREKVLGGADDEDTLGLLLMPVAVKARDGAVFEAHPASTVDATSAALCELLREGLVDLWRTGMGNVDTERVPPSEAEVIAADRGSWTPPRCWGYALALTGGGEAVWSAICDAKASRPRP